MKHNFTLTMLLLLTVACNGGGGGSSTDEVTDVDTIGTETGNDSGDADTGSDPVIVDSNLPALALSFDTNVSYMNFTSAQEDKYNQAVALVKKVVGTEAFRDSVLNHTYNGAKTYANNGGKTNAQIYQSILDAAEKLTPSKNNTMDVGVKLYYEASTVVGWTSGSITYINVNTKFFDSYAVNSVASNLFHEWLHKLGYGHDAAATTARPYSIPYAVGRMVGSIGRNFL